MNALDKAIYDYHNTFKTIPEILKEYNLTKYKFYHYLDYKEEWRTNHRARLYTFNLESFINDSIDKYYWLGFIAADGAIVKNSLNIELKDIDFSHLEKFQQFCQYTGQITTRINNQQVSCAKITLNSKELVQYLKQYNIMQNKSLLFTIPIEKIPPQYIFHFLRGLIDGDGCIRINNHQQISLDFCSGNQKCVEQVRDLINITNKIRLDGNTYRIQVTGNIKAKQILDKIYKDSNDSNRLTRKYNIYKTLN